MVQSGPACCRVVQKGMTIKADHGAQLRLLDLQELDSALIRLGHRRRTLPEHAELAELRSQRDSVGSDLVQAATEVSDLELEQEKAERDLTPVRQRLERNQQRVADGSVSDPKALSGLVDEIGHLRKRIGDLEDAELEVMEQLEDATARRAAFEQRAAVLDGEIGAVTERRDSELRQIAAEAGERNAERDALSPGLPTDLLALYDRLRASHGGIGAAELRARRCTGCQLELNAADLRGYAAAATDEVLRCEECGRILVRTAQSGL